MRFLYVVLWLAAITAANVISARYGPEASIYNAVVLIGLTLIVTGAALAYVVAPDAGKIGVASGVAFGASETVDARLLWGVTVGQFTAKVAGALFFTLLIERAHAAARHDGAPEPAQA
jgi:hypothetical protein